MAFCFENYLSNIKYDSFSHIIIGDFNIDVNNITKSCSFLSLIKSFGLSVLNKFDTRIGLRSKTRIDLLLTNKKAESYVQNVDYCDVSFSDHRCLLFNYKKKLTRNRFKSIERLIITSKKLSQFSAQINLFDLDALLNSSDDIFSMYVMQINNIIGNVFSKR